MAKLKKKASTKKKIATKGKVKAKARAKTKAKVTKKASTASKKKTSSTATKKASKGGSKSSRADSASTRKTAGKSKSTTTKLASKPSVSQVSIGQKVPNFSLPAGGGNLVSLEDLQGQNVVLYFYPKDNTPGCTQESRDFAALNAQFSRLGARVIGVSRDSVNSHEKFAAKYELPFSLLADESETLCRIFGVIQEKSLYGRKFMGVVRSTFLIDRSGVLLKEWRNVKVAGHAQEVLEYIQNHL